MGLHRHLIAVAKHVNLVPPFLRGNVHRPLHFLTNLINGNAGFLLSVFLLLIIHKNQIRMLFLFNAKTQTVLRFFFIAIGIQPFLRLYHIAIRIRPGLCAFFFEGKAKLLFRFFLFTFMKKPYHKVLRHLTKQVLFLPNHKISMMDSMIRYGNPLHSLLFPLPVLLFLQSYNSLQPFSQPRLYIRQNLFHTLVKIEIVIASRNAGFPELVLRKILVIRLKTPFQLLKSLWIISLLPGLGST